jgi:pSer/pThr/pTyr-binding forkhead associated (FHA) protein
MKKFRLIHQNSNLEAPEGRSDIGRSIDCYLVLNDPSVSRVHATIINTDDKLLIEDRGSRNGCSVNDVRVKGTRELGNGDVITIGHQTIKVVAIERNFEADRTVGLMSCPKCKTWMASADDKCPQCGYSAADIVASDSRATFQVDTGQFNRQEAGPKTQQPYMMIAGLIRKAISMDRFEEAERLIGNLMESSVRKETAEEEIPDAEIHEVTLCIAELAQATNNPMHVSRLFAFHTARGKLMPRESLDVLYGLVRKVGYRSCPDMSAYLSFLSSIKETFSPGQKFIHRRLEGLVGLCS